MSLFAKLHASMATMFLSPIWIVLGFGEISKSKMEWQDGLIEKLWRRYYFTWRHHLMIRTLKENIFKLSMYTLSFVVIAFSELRRGSGSGVEDLSLLWLALIKTDVYIWRKHVNSREKSLTEKIRETDRKKYMATFGEKQGKDTWPEDEDIRRFLKGNLQQIGDPSTVEKSLYFLLTCKDQVVEKTTSKVCRKSGTMSRRNRTENRWALKSRCTKFTRRVWVESEDYGNELATQGEREYHNTDTRKVLGTMKPTGYEET